MWFASSGILVMFLCMNPTPSEAFFFWARVENALNSLTQEIRGSSRTLNSYHQQEHYLNENLKRSVEDLSRKVSMVDRFEARFSHIEIQLSKLDQLISQINAMETRLNLKTESLIGASESRMTTQLKNIKATVTEISQRVEPTEPTPTTASVSAPDTISDPDPIGTNCIGIFARIGSGLSNTAIKNGGEAATRAEKLQTVFTEVQDITSRLGSIESYLERAEKTANEAEEKPKRPIVDVGAICKEQTKALGKVTELVEDTLNRIQVLPTTFEVQLLHNETQAALQETKHSLQSTVDDGINRIINSVGEHNNETKDTIENLRTDLATTAGNVNQTLRQLESGRKVMVSTADDVITLKKRLEYGISGITTNVDDLRKSHDAGNKNLNDKIDKISNDIIDNHRKELKNLTSKTDEGLKQIWRQIGVLYQKMDTNGEALDNLYKQNEICVNGTIPAIVGLRVEVAVMQSHVNGTESNLNYLLQQRSLMTQEFDRIKSNLRNVLSDIKSSVKEIQEKTEDLKHFGSQQNPPDSNEESNTKSNQMEPFGTVAAQ